MIATLNTPKNFDMHVGKDIILNGADIFSEINQLIIDYEGKQWKDFGY